jgi:hypothetical protein
MTKTCQTCGSEFTPKRSTAKYCPGGSCRVKAWRKRNPDAPGLAKMRREHVGSRRVRSNGPWRDPHDDGAQLRGGTSWMLSDSWERHDTLIDAHGMRPLGQPVRDSKAEPFHAERRECERKEAEIRERIIMMRRALAKPIPRLTSAECRELIIETARAFVAWGMPIRMLPGLLQDLYRLAYKEECVNALIANDLHEAIRLEGEKTRAEVRELGNLIVGTVIAREGHPADAAEEILTAHEDD